MADGGPGGAYPPQVSSPGATRRLGFTRHLLREPGGESGAVLSVRGDEADQRSGVGGRRLAEGDPMELRRAAFLQAATQAHWDPETCAQSAQMPGRKVLIGLL